MGAVCGAPSREKEIQMMEVDISAREKAIADLQAQHAKKEKQMNDLGKELELFVIPRTLEDIEELNRKLKAVRQKTAPPARSSALMPSADGRLGRIRI